jgi:hypothetical protein
VAKLPWGFGQSNAHAIAIGFIDLNQRAKACIPCQKEREEIDLG